MTCQSLGQMFGTNAIVGPRLINYCEWHGAHLYFVGEEHDTNGVGYKHKNHVVRHIEAHSRTHPTRVYIELSPGQVTEYNEYLKRDPNMEPKSPMYGFVHHALQGKFKNPPALIHSDVRKVPPYNIEFLVRDPAGFTVDVYGLRWLQHILPVRKLAKVAEKELMKNISTRSDAKDFLESLCLPDREYAKWFVDFQSNLGNTQLPSPLRDMLAEVRTRDASMYARLVDHVRSYYKPWDVSAYTPAFRRIESMRRTANSRVVAEKDSLVNDVFVEMTTYLFDVYVIAHFLLNPPAKDEAVVIMAGMNHTMNIVRFFERYTTVWFKFDADGNLPEGNAILGYQVPRSHIRQKLIALKNRKQV
jgi:hypothetical protein